MREERLRPSVGEVEKGQLMSMQAEAWRTMRRSDRLRAWFVVVPVVGYGFAGAHGPQPTAAWSALAAPAAGLVLGGLWHVVDRRDVVQQLSLAAYLTVVTVVVTSALLALSAPHLSLYVNGFTYILGVMAGLVVVEDQIRRRDRRAGRGRS